MHANNASYIPMVYIRSDSLQTDPVVPCMDSQHHYKHHCSKQMCVRNTVENRLRLLHMY